MYDGFHFFLLLHSWLDSVPTVAPPEQSQSPCLDSSEDSRIKMALMVEILAFNFVGCGYIPNMLNCHALCFKKVKSILTKKPGGKCILNEYNRTKSLMDET